MAVKNLTSKQVEEALNSAICKISALESRHRTLESEHRILYAKYQDALNAIKDQNRRLALYENANSPPSANSLEYKSQEDQQAEER